MPDFQRYHRQMLLPGIGEDGQRLLAESRVLLVGCGALGTVIADMLTRAGVGTLVLVDRDFAEQTNLQRQVLFTEADAAESMPKAVAAQRRLQAVNSEIRLVAEPVDFSAANAERLAEDCDLLIDGTDNFETRFLLNDLSVKLAIPYVYGGAVGTAGTLFTILPRTPGGDAIWEQTNGVDAGPCLRCLFDEPPPPGSMPTCDTAGVLGPLASLVACHQSIEAIKILTGNWSAVDRRLRSIDAWQNAHHAVRVENALRDDCPCCAGRQFEYLDGGRTGGSTSLCGRDAVQVMPNSSDARLDLKQLAQTLSQHGKTKNTGFTVRVELSFEGKSRTVTIFPDGRAIVQGTTDPVVARALYSRYIGS